MTENYRQMSCEEKEDAERERAISTARPLRFDGYAYEPSMEFFLTEHTTAYLDDRVMPEDAIQPLAVLFAMQRWLGK